jgi:hypothetical protein
MKKVKYIALSAFIGCALSAPSSASANMTHNDIHAFMDAVVGQASTQEISYERELEQAKTMMAKYDKARSSVIKAIRVLRERSGIQGRVGTDYLEEKAKVSDEELLALRQVAYAKELKAMRPATSPVSVVALTPSSSIKAVAVKTAAKEHEVVKKSAVNTRRSKILFNNEMDDETDGDEMDEDDTKEEEDYEEMMAEKPEIKAASSKKTTYHIPKSISDKTDRKSRRSPLFRLLFR